MSSYDKRKIYRLYGDGKTYVVTSQANEAEKLQIKLVNSAVCITKMSNEEWEAQTRNRTNSVRTPSSSFSLLLDSYGCLGILSTPSLTTGFQQQINPNAPTTTMHHILILVKDAANVGQIKKCDIMRITDVYLLPLNTEDSYLTSNINANLGSNANQNSNFGYLNDIRKFLSSGVFYFAFSPEPSIQFDLTLSSQHRNSSHTQSIKKFLWNYNIMIPFRRLNIDIDSWLIKMICGFVDIKKVIISHKTFKSCIISRMSCDRVGTRFNCRGINDDGYCANFVETEQIIFSEDTFEECSYMQIRGSVPLFFEQTGMQVGNHRLKRLRSLVACYPAFDRHFRSLMQDYGSKIFVLNLLGTRGDEYMLTEWYQRLCEFSPFHQGNQLSYLTFDYHQEMKVNKQALGERMWPRVVDSLYSDNHTSKSYEGMFFHLKQTGDDESSFKTNTSQSKFIRTNCMDCLDRTNNAQTFIGIEMLRFQLKEAFGITNESELNKFREVFRQMWILNGDSISKQYAGTGAIQGKSVTADLTKSITRAIQNNFRDGAKQDAMDIVLYGNSRNYGPLAERIRTLMPSNCLRLPHSILKEMVKTNRMFTEKVKCRVCIGTWNINGGLAPRDMESLNLNDWLIDGPFNAKKSGFGYLDANVQSDTLDEIDIFAVGFEEMVDLNASNIVSASDDNARIWQLKIQEFLKKHGDYVPIIDEYLQLVGVCLFVFVLRKHVSFIRDVCVSRNKTGLHGTAGNKGGVLLRFVYYNTSMCFVCSHFAAHQNQIRQRNEDFKEIFENSEFSGQTVASGNKLEVKSHDYVFWCGDLNYRIDMANDNCRQLISECAWKVLLEQEQLCVQMQQGNVFKEFAEAPLNFPPTYKYNLYEDSYDRSEKCRVPAWTDRVLWRRRRGPGDAEDPSFSFGKCLYYGRADIRFSDHRPVTALLEVDVDQVIPTKLIRALDKVLTASHGTFQVTLIVTTHTNQMDDDIRNEILKLFSAFKTFANFKELNNALYITYSDARFAYEAYGQLSNYNLERFDLVLQIRVENEDNIRKLIEHEINDCLSTLLNVDSYTRRASNARRPSSSQPANVETADLLGVDNYDEVELIPTNFINVPAQIHSSLSITNHMHTVNALNLEEGFDGHQYHNPALNKALSNSNLTMFDHPASDAISANLIDTGSRGNKYVHSAANLLDLVDEDAKSISADSLRSYYSQQSSSSSQPSLPPRRPPPPPTNSQASMISNSSINSKNIDPFEQAFSTDFGQTTAPIIHVESAKSLSPFDDDFGAVFSNNQAAPKNDDPFSPVSKPEASRPPPLPPMANKPETTPCNPLFTLFDDDFGSIAPPPVPPMTTAVPVKSQQPPLPPMPATMPNRPPPLPPMPANTNTQSQAPPTLPPLPTNGSSSSSQPAPPLPPPPNYSSSSTLINTNGSNSNSMSKMQPNQVPKLPPRPTTVPQPSGAPVMKPNLPSPPRQLPANSKDTAFDDLLNNFNSAFSTNAPDKSNESNGVSKPNPSALPNKPPPLPPRPSNMS